MDKYFETPAYVRPFLGLGITALPESLQVQRLKDADVGPANLANFVVGLTLDEASRQGVRVGRVNEALDVGDLTLKAYVFSTVGHQARGPADNLWFRPEYMASLAVSLFAHGNKLSLLGGRYAKLPHGIVYTKEEESYTPVRSLIVEGDPPRSRMHTFPENYNYQPLNGESGSMPDEFRAASVLGGIANVIRAGLDERSLVVRSDFQSRMLGDHQGHGSG